RNSIACQTKCPGRLLQRGWAPQERRILAWVTGWQASIRHDDRRSRARWNADGDHKSSIWFSTTDGARELVCADVALSGNHCERFAEFAAEFVRLKVDVEAVTGPRTQWSTACPPARCERPPRRRAAEQRDELATFNAAVHSITSPARASSVGGTSRPRALAVFRLMTSSPQFE